MWFPEGFFLTVEVYYDENYSHNRFERWNICWLTNTVQTKRLDTLSHSMRLLYFSDHLDCWLSLKASKLWMNTLRSVLSNKDKSQKSSNKIATIFSDECFVHSWILWISFRWKSPEMIFQQSLSKLPPEAQWQNVSKSVIRANGGYFNQTIYIQILRNFIFFVVVVVEYIPPHAFIVKMPSEKMCNTDQKLGHTWDVRCFQTFGLYCTFLPCI